MSGLVENCTSTGTRCHSTCDIEPSCPLNMRPPGPAAEVVVSRRGRDEWYIDSDNAYMGLCRHCGQKAITVNDMVRLDRSTPCTRSIPVSELISDTDADNPDWHLDRYEAQATDGSTDPRDTCWMHRTVSVVKGLRAARAERDAMRPVIEAAQKMERWLVSKAFRGQSEKRLLDALDTYAASMSAKKDAK